MVNVSYNIPSSILRLFSYYPSLDTIHLPGPNLRFPRKTRATVALALAWPSWRATVREFPRFLSSQLAS